MTTFGTRLKAFRKSLSMSQEEFGQQIGLTKSAVSKCELDKSFMSEETLKGLAINLGANLNYLIAGLEGQKNKDNSDLVSKIEQALKNKGIL